ncbi:nitroreductase family protein [Dongia sedimenti]|uniref:Nitroreductase n=1 Tax=Dongia sedimenti TaxID=3064282 RepID=A0ABU0YSL8_9PROT|nr:nitroreductase [Rhodospirillaceae bacterium R-7]
MPPAPWEGRAMPQFGDRSPEDCDARSACVEGEIDRARIARDVSWLAGRRSVAVKRLGAPGPNSGELEIILRAALAAPDHGALRPWRVVRCSQASRARLADLFVTGKRERHPDSTEVQLEREREKAMRPPVLLALIASPKRGHDKVPVEEQLATAGAAIQSMLIAAHGQGYGAIILSGSRCSDPGVCAALEVGTEETLLGFLSIGSIVEEPKLAPRPKLQDVAFDFDGDRIVPMTEAGG